MAFEYKASSWPFTADCFGPPCDPIHGWAITVFKGTSYLHCGWDKSVTEEFINGGDNNCPGYPGNVCPHGDEAFEIANQKWIEYFGGSGNNPDSGPFNNDCYHNNGMTRDSCTGYNCHGFPSRTTEPSPAPMPTPAPSPVPMPVPRPTPGPTQCHAISAVVTDDWCVQNCAAGFCPSDLCECDSSIHV